MPSTLGKPHQRLLRVLTLLLALTLILPARALAHGPFAGVSDVELVLALLFVFGVGPMIAGFSQRRSRKLRLGAVLMGIILGTVAGAMMTGLVMAVAVELDSGWAGPVLAYCFLGGFALSCVLTIKAAVWLDRGE